MLSAVKIYSFVLWSNVFVWRGVALALCISLHCLFNFSDDDDDDDDDKEHGFI